MTSPPRLFVLCVDDEMFTSARSEPHELLTGPFNQGAAGPLLTKLLNVKFSTKSGGTVLRLDVAQRIESLTLSWLEGLNHEAVIADQFVEIPYFRSLKSLTMRTPQFMLVLRKLEAMEDQAEQRAQLLVSDGTQQGLSPHVLLLDNLVKGPEGARIGVQLLKTCLHNRTLGVHDDFRTVVLSRFDLNDEEISAKHVHVQKKGLPWDEAILRDLEQFCGSFAVTRTLLMPSMRGVSAPELRRFAQSGEPLLIYGETGTGKRALAHRIHTAGGGTDDNFVYVNCGALPAEGNLAHTELFGIGKDVATSVAPTVGKLARAHGGTLFLDEIHRLPPVVQGALLDALETGEFSPVGCLERVQATFRVVAATNDRDVVSDEVFEPDAERPFAHDLAARLRVIEIHLPTLQEETATGQDFDGPWSARLDGLFEDVKCHLCSRLERLASGKPIDLPNGGSTQFVSWKSLAQRLSLPIQTHMDAGLVEAIRNAQITQDGRRAIFQAAKAGSIKGNFRGLRHLLVRAMLREAAKQGSGCTLDEQAITDAMLPQVAFAEAEETNTSGEPAQLDSKPKSGTLEDVVPWFVNQLKTRQKKFGSFQSLRREIESYLDDASKRHSQYAALGVVAGYCAQQHATNRDVYYAYHTGAPLLQLFENTTATGHIGEVLKVEFNAGKKGKPADIFHNVALKHPVVTQVATLVVGRTVTFRRRQSDAKGS